MKPKRILIISAYFPPLPSVASLRVYSFAKYWARMGNEVTVLTTKKIDRGNLNLDLPKDNFDVIEVPYFNIIYETGKILKKLLKDTDNGSTHRNIIVDKNNKSKNSSTPFLKVSNLSYKLRNLLGLFITDRIPDVHDAWIYPAIKKGEGILNFNKYDWIFSSYAPPASHMVAGILSRKYGCRWVADYRDLWIENHVWVGKWPFAILERHLERKYVGNYADIITTVSRPLAKTLQEKFKVPVCVIENGYDEDDYKQRFNAYFKDRKKKIVYTGAIYPQKQDPSPLFAAISAMAQRDKDMKSKMDANLEVLFYGGHNDWLNGLIEKYKVQPWVKYMGMVNRYDVLCIQKQADILLSLEWEDGSVDGIMTAKLFEYLAMRKPILGVGVSAKTSPGALMEDAGVGIAAGNDVDKIISIIQQLLVTDKPFDIHPQEEVINRYTRRKQAERLLKLMDIN